MDVFVSALGILAASLLLAAFSGGRSWANTLGAGSACLGCVLGFASLFADPWNARSLLELPWGLPLGACVVGLDPLTRVFLAPAFGLGAVCALSGAEHLSHSPPHEHNLGAHWAFYILLVLAMSLVLAARDAVLFLLAWELMSLAPFFLIDLYDNDAQVREASWIYLVAAHLGAVFLIAMFGLLWAQTGATSFEAFALATFSPDTGSALFVLALVGFGAKAGIAPFHVWLPEAHPAAPSHISAMLSGAMINVGIYGLTRSLTFFGDGAVWWGWALIGAGVCTGLLGILKALGQSDLKRLLAYSSVENMGIALTGIGTGYIGVQAGNAWVAALGYGAAFFHVLNHAAMKGLLFLCAGEVLHGVHSARLEFLGGLQKRMPWVGTAFALGAAAIACLPPLNGFSGKFLLLLALLREGAAPQGLESQMASFGAVIALVFMGGLTAAAFVKAYGIGFLGEPRSGAAQNAVEPGWLNRICLLVPASCCVCLALGAPWFFSLMNSAALSLFPAGMDRRAGALAALEGAKLLEQCLLPGALAVAMIFALWLARMLLLRRNGVRKARTWDCGYQAGTARIQYSAASFVEPLTRLFAAVMGFARRYTQRGDLFPSRAACEVRLSDRLLGGVFTPLFEGARQVCDGLKFVQHGHIHIYILYILVVIVVLLVWGLRT